MAQDSLLDTQQLMEWLESLEAVVEYEGRERAGHLLRTLLRHAAGLGIEAVANLRSPYRNTIAVEHQPAYPGDLEVERRLTAIMRWNALAMVVRANRAYGELGGHIASYASAAEIFEVGFHHFFRGPNAAGGADLVFFQPHSAPGVYARAFLEGRLSEEQLANFRQEISGKGLSSYPHPWLMPDFWQFPTGSMGLGPLSAIYQARFMRYLEHRGLAATASRRVWGVFGDGEMDEPESIAGLTLAARERLSNLTLIVNCNLQRLDGPVRGNGQIIQELEALFTGAGWNVIKVLWGSRWDSLFEQDAENALIERFETTVDGEFQTLGAKDGAYNLQHFFSSTPALKKLTMHLSPEDVESLNRGGHDLSKLHAAFAAAVSCTDRPTAILVKTKKGYGMGEAGESKMTSHQQKKLEETTLREVRDRLKIPLTDAELAHVSFYRPAEDSVEIRYLRAQRDRLGGSLPQRRRMGQRVAVPALESYAGFALEASGKAMPTTMALIRLFNGLLKDRVLGPRVVPIVADEARTFGMANLFRQIGIYAPDGQRYEPEDAGSMLAYHEKRDGQLLEEGISEAGALSSWLAAATSYSVHDVPLLPFYIFYSMFGFQRVGDLIWAAADQRARGFLIGATAGRTTLGGEGLQHQDGTSQLIASTVPNCRAYDPAFAGELAVILDHGARGMLERGQDEFYYITVMNESYEQPSLAAIDRDAVIEGMYLFWERHPEAERARVHLLGSGAIFREVLEAARLLEADWQVGSSVFSVTSFSELARGARSVERFNRLNPTTDPRKSHLQRLLPTPQVVIAASDYVAAYPQLIAPYVRGRYVTLGTDGFGRSDTRAALRRFFEVDRYHVAVAALAALADEGNVPRSIVALAIARYELDAQAAPPWTH
jgi:pyruvate dehydrogenase E1 component